MGKSYNRIGETNKNYQGCPMIIAEYINSNNIVIEFQDKYKSRIHTTYAYFKKGDVRNPYYPSVYGHGIIGAKYRVNINYKIIKEYKTWSNIIRRCFDEKEREKRPTYKDVTCCDEWLLFENFYEWIHNQDNFDKWLNGNRWTIDKDILIKGNKIYSPNTCCLVPENVNTLFTKCNAIRGSLPIGVRKCSNKFQAICMNHFTNKQRYIGSYFTPTEAFYLGYKPYKENLIKQVAQEEYSKGNITKMCYDAMMNYEVEITD